MREAIATQNFSGAHGVYAVTVDQLCGRTGKLYSYASKRDLKCIAGNMVQGNFGVDFVDHEERDELCAPKSFEDEVDEN